MIKNFKKISSITSLMMSTTFLIIFSLNIVSLIAQNFGKKDIPSFLGYCAFVVQSENIRDNNNDLDFVVVKKANEKTLSAGKNGDVMAFRYGDKFVVAKLESIYSDGKTTYCDFLSNDKKYRYLGIESYDIIGKSVFTLNKFGKFIVILNEYLWIYTLLSIVLEVLIIYLIFKNTISRKKELL